MSERQWLDSYTGQTTDELIALEGNYRIDSLIIAFEEALNQKSKQDGRGTLGEEEFVVLAIAALEREVNTGGYDQLFINPSKEHTPLFVAALNRIGCREIAVLTQQAIDSLGIEGEITVETIDRVMEQENVKRDEILSNCDETYYAIAGDLAIPLFDFIKRNREKINLKN